MRAQISEVHRALANQMPERELQDLVRQTAIARGWLFYHTRNSRGSDKGFLDCHIVRGKTRLVRELKTQTGKLTDEQKVWFAAHRLLGDDVDVWRPSHWYDGTIERELA